MQTTMRSGALLAVVVIAASCSGSPGVAPSSVPSPTPRVAQASSTASPTPALMTIAPETLRSRLDEGRARYGSPGALALLERGGARDYATSGTADSAGAPITATSRFRIGSITKPIVATLVLDAVARNKLSLDDVVGDLLPGVLRPKPAITVRQLLDHTSGVFDELNEGNPLEDIAKLTDPALEREAAALAERYQAGEHVIASDRLLVALAETHPRYFAPGTDYHYSNTNYQLAVMVLEKATGTSVAELLRTRIAQPLGLRHTSIAPPDTSTPDFHGYVRGSDVPLADVSDDLLAFGNGGNGGIISTADELLTIMEAITSGRLLPADLVVAMKEPHLASYGLGLATYALPCGVFYGHGGSVNGTQSIALASDDGRAGVVIAYDLVSSEDPGLAGLASRMLCAGT